MSAGMTRERVMRAPRRPHRSYRVQIQKTCPITRPAAHERTVSVSGSRRKMGDERGGVPSLTRAAGRREGTSHSAVPRPFRGGTASEWLSSSSTGRIAAGRTVLQAMPGRPSAAVQPALPHTLPLPI
jgi:hypothetical protein